MRQIDEKCALESCSGVGFSSASEDAEELCVVLVCSEDADFFCVERHVIMPWGRTVEENGPTLSCGRRQSLFSEYYSAVTVKTFF